MADQTEDLVTIPIDEVQLEGELILPDGAAGLVVFAHGSGSSRKSPRNNFVAEVLRTHGLGTLLFDLLTEEEDQEYETRFNIDLLTTRLVERLPDSMELTKAAGTWFRTAQFTVISAAVSREWLMNPEPMPVLEWCIASNRRSQPPVAISNRAATNTCTDGS